MRLMQVLPRVPVARTLLVAGFAAAATGLVHAQADAPGTPGGQAESPVTPPGGLLADWLASDIPSNTEAEKLIRGRLARALAQQSRLLLQRDQIYIGGLEAAKTLMLLAVRLDPENPYIWRLMLDLCASLEEGDDEAARVYSEALSRLSRLDPTDEVIRLRRILDSISRRQTAEERIAAIEKLLAPDTLARIGNGVGARLAFELAVLRQRIGDTVGFERELIRTLDLDPVYPEAAEIAAGYFRMQAPGKAEEASALRTAVIANPSRTPAALGLAALCLENGAYAAAAEILNVEAAVLETNMPDLEFDALLADLTLALWGSGQPEVAFSVVKKRQDQVDRILLMEYDRRGVPLDTAQRRAAKLPLSVALATNAAAIASVIGGDRAKVAVQNAAISSETQVLALEREKADEADIARAALEAVFVQLWLDGNVQTATNFYERAVKATELEPVAKARFDGWFALRGGDAAKAKELLAPQADTDLGSNLGLAVALESLGDRKEAARRYLTIARSMPAAAIGLWARSRLRAIVGSDVDVLEGAKAVEAAAALPPEFYDLMSNGRDRMLLRVKPRNFEVRAWDPMVFDIEFTNRSGWPMAISPDGPVLDNATISTAVNAAGRKVSVPAFSIVPIDRAFVIPPGETLSVPFDLSLTDVALAIRADPVNGALISVHSIVNWRTTMMGIEPGPLGIEADSPIVHVSGEKLTKEWVDKALASVAESAASPDPESIALLAFAVNRAIRAPESIDAATREALQAAPRAIAEAVGRLSPEARAWLVLAGPIGRRSSDRATSAEVVEAATGGGIELPSTVRELEAFDAALRQDQHPLVRVAWIAARVQRSEDPVMAATASLPDPRLSSLAQNYRAWLADAEAERRRKLNLNP